MSSATTPNPPSASDPTGPGPRMGEAGPQVLLVHYTYTQQSRAMSDAMADGFRERGCAVTQSAIELVDERYAPRFSRFPMDNAFWGVVRMLPAQLLRKTGRIQIAPEAQAGGYDLVCVFSPTWWLTTSLPVRSFLKSRTTRVLLEGARFTDVVVCRRYWGGNHRTVKKLGIKAGGEYVEGIHFAYAGGQIRSLLSLISYLGSGTYRARYCGVSIPRTNLTDAQLGEGRAFAGTLANRLAEPASSVRST
jgi:hypothetical protein